MATSPSHYFPGRIQVKRNSVNFRRKSIGQAIIQSIDRSCSDQKLSIVHTSASQSSIVDLVEQTPNKCASEFLKSSEAALILIRHGESMWNERNLFTGCVDVPLNEKGVQEAINAGRRISNIPVDLIYTSSLIRAQMTAMLAMTQHRRKMVPVIMHDESEQAKAWSQMYSAKTRMQSIPVVTAWQLNERMYGNYRGLTRRKLRRDMVRIRFMSGVVVMIFPLQKGESLKMCAERAFSYFKEQIEPQLQSGKNVLISAHGNSLRSIIMYLDQLTCHEVISLELSTGMPMLYIFKEGEFTRKGSPVGPTEVGVYAYTRNLALYRQGLDEMLN